ncbi:MAG: 2-oxoisovalerate dehydrogenase E1 component alpha subunit [Glaciecola sp.]|jgi:2-oxoisovalerate dehydrogenase E1 component alpha subunit
MDPRDMLPPDEPVHLLDADGTYHPNEEWPLDLKDEDFTALYKLMLTTRRVDKETINLQRQGQLGVYASCMGQEAAQVGSAYALLPEDWVFPSYRELGAALTRGVDQADLCHLWRGTWLTNHDPYEHNFGMLAIPIGTQALHATGFAMGAKFDDNPIVTMSYFGDGATSEGDPHEALNFAAVFEAPVIFFVQNNQWAISVPLSKQTAAPTIAHKAVGYGMPGLRCDGNDVLATVAVTKYAVERARRGEGPALIEAMTYRMEAHTTSDDTSRYRTKEEEAEAAQRDPIVRMRNFLKKQDLFTEELDREVEEHVAQQTTLLREEIYEAPHGDPYELFDHVYGNPGTAFDLDRATLTSELEDGDSEWAPSRRDDRHPDGTAIEGVARKQPQSPAHRVKEA